MKEVLAATISLFLGLSCLAGGEDLTPLRFAGVLSVRSKCKLDSKPKEHL